MLEFRLRLTGHDLVITRTFGVGEHFTLEVWQRGEHQDDPSHKYHKPNKMISSTYLTKDQMQEFVSMTERMM